MNTEVMEINRLKALYEDFNLLHEIVYSRHPVGGDLHIVLDDHNVEDDHLKFCADLINKENDDDPSWYKIVMLAILAMLAELDMETRERFVENRFYV